MTRTVDLWVTLRLHAVIHKEDDGYRVEVPALPCCAAQGATLGELFLNLDEMIMKHRSHFPGGLVFATMPASWPCFQGARCENDAAKR